MIGVYGLGRFGAFWAEQLARRHEVVAWSRNASRSVPKGVRRVSEKELFAADTVILCVSISSMKTVLERIAGHLAPGTLVMDTCSVKMYPVRLMQELLPPEIDILATHPMFGPDSGRQGLSGLPIVCFPVRLDEQRADFWRKRFEDLGLRVVTMEAEAHDREAAYTQGITHFIGRVLGELGLNDSVIATQGYRALQDIVRQTCNDHWELFVDLQKYNPFTMSMRRELHAALAVTREKFDSIEFLQED